MAHQLWTDKDFCDAYERTWDISTEEVHYGWLAPGENYLQLLRDVRLSDARILDIGCGMGENLIALARRGADGVGIDISPWMIEKAQSKTTHNGSSGQISHYIMDMRKIGQMSTNGFTVILSIYSMEYLKGVREFRQVIQAIYHKLAPNGIFMMCFSHPSQARQHRQIANSSVALGSGDYRTYNWSFWDTTRALCKCGFSIERIVEQWTENPSQLKHEEIDSFPYHFHKGHNPCDPRFDSESNEAPHSVIYKARKPLQDPVSPRRRSQLRSGYRRIWGVRRKILRHSQIPYLGFSFTAIWLSSMDNVLGLVDILDFSIRHSDLPSENDSIVNADPVSDPVHLEPQSLLAIINKRLVAMGLQPNYVCQSVQNENDHPELRVYVSGIDGLDREIKAHFATDDIGLLVFVNGEEPASGELPIDTVTVAKGDRLLLTYVACRSSSDKPKSGEQLRLL